MPVARAGVARRGVGEKGAQPHHADSKEIPVLAELDKWDKHLVPEAPAILRALRVLQTKTTPRLPMSLC